MTDKAEKKTWVTWLQRAGIVAAALTAIATLSFGVDGRYQKAEAADEQVLEMQQQVAGLASDREEGDVDNQIEIILVELKYLNAKTEKNSDDELRIDMLKRKLTILLTRQTELQK